MTAPFLIGFSDSVYSQAARFGLLACKLRFDWKEVDPFHDADALDGLHPFAQVPVLQHDGFTLYETAAILVYADALAGGVLFPQDPQARARVMQVISLVNAHLYGPLVRQVYAQAVYRPAHGQSGDAATIRQGLDAAPRCLDAFEATAREAFSLRIGCLDAGAVLLAPMLHAFVQCPEGQALLDQRAHLRDWLVWITSRADFRRAVTEQQPEEYP